MRLGPERHIRVGRFPIGFARAPRLALALAAASLCWIGPVRAEEVGQPVQVWHSLLETLDIRAKPAVAPDFVEATRPDPSTLRFLPTTAPHPPRETPAKSASQIEATKAQLDAARARQLQPPVPAAPPVPAKSGGPKRVGAKKPAAASSPDRVASAPRS